MSKEKFGYEVYSDYAEQMIDAVKANDIESVKAILAINPNLSKVASNADELAEVGVLGLAVEQRNVELVKLLLENGADINQSFYDCHDSLLHVAVEYGDKPMIRCLLEHKIDLGILNEKGQTAKEYALSKRPALEGIVEIFDDYKAQEIHLEQETWKGEVESFVDRIEVKRTKKEKNMLLQMLIPLVLHIELSQEELQKNLVVLFFEAI